MNDAPNFDSAKLENKLSSIKSKLPFVHENKLKNLEARFMGPSANGSLPCEYELISEMDYDYIKSSKLFKSLFSYFLKNFYINKKYSIAEFFLTI